MALVSLSVVAMAGRDVEQIKKHTLHVFVMASYEKHVYFCFVFHSLILQKGSITYITVVF